MSNMKIRGDTNIANFINELIDTQKLYNKNKDFLERIQRDIYWVEKKEVEEKVTYILKYGSDGIKGDLIYPGDEFFIPGMLVKKYQHQKKKVLPSIDVNKDLNNEKN